MWPTLRPMAARRSCTAGLASTRASAADRHVLETRQPQLGEGGHLGHHGLARAAQHRHHVQLAGLVVLDEVRDAAHAGGDLVAQHVGHHGRAAAVGRGHQVQLELLGDHLDQELGHRRRRRHAHRALAALRAAQPGHVVVEAPGRRAARHRERVHEGGEAGHGHEVPGRVEARCLHHLGQDADAVVVAQEHRVAVGRGRLQRLGRQLPAGAGLVLDDDGGAAQFVLQAFGQDAGDGVGAAAGRKAHQHAQGAAGLGTRRAHGGQQG